MIVRPQTAQRMVGEPSDRAGTGRAWDMSARPNPATRRQAIWLQRFKRKFCSEAVRDPIHIKSRGRRSISLRAADRFAALHSSDFSQFCAARAGFSRAICATFAFSSSASKAGNEQMRLLQANAAGSPRSGYSTSGLGSLPSRRSSHSSRL